MQNPILPVKGKRNILITSALPYSNNTPHLGNLIGCVLSADVYSRYTKLRGYNSLYICGTDEYGTATEMKAEKEKVTPKEICEKYFKIHKEIYDWFGIKFDYFGHTATPKHTEITTDIFKKLDENGYIFERNIQQHYCSSCDRYLADRFLEGTCPVCGLAGARGDQCDSCGEIYESLDILDPRCQPCGNPAELCESRHLFLALKKLKPRASIWMESCIDKGGWSDNTAKLSHAWLRKLEDRCITRSLKWGTPVSKSGFDDKVFYVWFDAPIGYISITANAVGDWEKWWKSEDVEYHQFMGKDNVTFHTSIFPSTLIGTGEKYTMAEHINTTEYLNFQGGKFSKSHHRGVFGDDAKKTGVPPDAWRYYLISNRPEISDSDFNWDDFGNKINSELNNNFGNFVNRTLVFIKSRFEGKVPPLGILDNESKDFVEKINENLKTYIRSMESTKMTRAARITMGISSLSNGFYQSRKPWTTIKSKEADQISHCGQTLNICFQMVGLIGSLMSPFLPFTSEEIEKQINTRLFPLRRDTIDFSEEFDGVQIGNPRVLFEHIKEEKINEFKIKFGGKEEKVFPLDLIVGTVEDVSDHPNAERLYILTVVFSDTFSTRIVSGLKDHYEPKDLINRKVIVVKNLKKVKFKGIISNGMILCGKKNDSIKIVTTNARNGERAVPKGMENSVKIEKRFNAKKDFAKLRLKVDSQGSCFFENYPLVVNGGELSVDGGLVDCDLV